MTSVSLKLDDSISRGGTAEPVGYRDGWGLNGDMRAPCEDSRHYSGVRERRLENLERKLRQFR